MEERNYDQDWQEFCLTDGLTEREMKMRGYLRYWMFQYSQEQNRLQQAEADNATLLKELERLRKVAKAAKNVLQWNKPGRTMTVALEVAQAIALEQALADLEKEGED